MTLLFDTFWDEDGDPYGRSPGDTNVYTTGRIGCTDVVLLTLPDVGTNSAASASTHLLFSFRNLELVLLVGVCGGVPTVSGQDTFLGDVVIGSSIVQYDFGRQYDGEFALGVPPADALRRAAREVRPMLAHITMERTRTVLRRQAGEHLRHLQQRACHERRRAQYGFPDAETDILYPVGYVHKHRTGCDMCSTDEFCEMAMWAPCADVGCDPAEKVKRSRWADGDREVGYEPKIVAGPVGSANTDMKSGVERDRLAVMEDIVAFEMEAAGVWDEVPCLVVKGVSGYADSHGTKAWENFAAATAASVARAVIERYVVEESESAPVEEMAQMALN